MKLTRVYGKDKSIGGTTLGVKWRYNGDKGEMIVPENVGRALVATGDFAEIEGKAAVKKAAIKVDPLLDSDGETSVIYINEPDNTALDKIRGKLP